MHPSMGNALLWVFFTIKHIEGVVAYKLNKIKLIKI